MHACIQCILVSQPISPKQFPKEVAGAMKLYVTGDKTSGTIDCTCELAQLVSVRALQLG